MQCGPCTSCSSDERPRASVQRNGRMWEHPAVQFTIHNCKFTISHCKFLRPCHCPPVGLACCGTIVMVRAVNCISSHVCSPQWTSTLGSGFDLFADELSNHAIVFRVVPFGSLSGSLKT